MGLVDGKSSPMNNNGIDVGYCEDTYFFDKFTENVNT